MALISNGGTQKRAFIYAFWAFRRCLLISISVVQASSQAAVITEYPIPTPDSGPEQIVVGSDGALWFTESSSNKIGRITVTGVFSEYAIPTASSHPQFPALGPDGAIWFSEYFGKKIGQITTEGTITEFPLISGFAPISITAGPDGAMWFTEVDATGDGTTAQIGRISVTGSVSEFPTPSGTITPAGIAVGPDHALWFCADSVIGRMDTSGVVTIYPTAPAGGSYPNLGIVSGPDGALWFGTASHYIGRITTTGIVTEYSATGVLPGTPALGADGALWFSSEWNGVNLVASSGLGISRVTTGGGISTYGPTSEIVGVVSGPDGAIWFTELAANKIGRLALPLSISPVSGLAVPNGVLQVPYSATPSAQGGVLPYTWSISGGPLPPGLFLNTQTGVISGAPNIAGTYNFSLSVSDNSATPQNATEGVAITISANNIPEFSVYPVEEFDSAGYITSGSDGALWFTASSGSQTKIGRITTVGSISAYPIINPALGAETNNSVSGFALGSDGNVWFTNFSNTLNSSYIGRITPNGGTAEYLVQGNNSGIADLTTGPDGNLWFTTTSDENAYMDLFTTQPVLVQQILVARNSEAEGLTLGADGAVWFAQVEAKSVTRVVGGGSPWATQYPVPNPAAFTAAGTDGALWYTESQNIGRITSGGSVIEFPISHGPAAAITQGSDGAMWFIESGAVGRITTSGMVTEFSTNFASPSPFNGIASGSDGAIWFTSNNAIVRLGFAAHLSVSCTLPDRGTLGVSYFGSCAVSGGVPPYSFTVTNGSLPPGLNVSFLGSPLNTINISGVPTSFGPFSFTLTIMDSGSSAQTTTAATTVTIAPPVAITSLNPNAKVAGGAGFTLAVNGSEFVSDAVVQWNGTALMTTFVTATQLTASVPASLIANPGGATVSVLSGGVTSNGLAFSIQVPIAAPSINTSSLLNGIVGTGYSALLTAQGGVSPYTWSIASGTLPPGLSLAGGTGLLSGAPTTAIISTFSVLVMDSAGQRASKVLSIVVNPLITVSLPSGTQQPESSITTGQVQSAQPVPEPVTGTLSLSFNENAANLPNPYMNPGLCFSTTACGSSLQTSVSFTIPAESSAVPVPAVQTGSVAGDIVFTLTVPGQPTTISLLTVPRTAPIIEANSVQILDATSTGFVVELVATSTPRDVQTAHITFNAASGAQLNGAVTFNLDVSSVLAQWYSSTQGQSYGSAFSLQVPFGLSGDFSAIQSVTVTLTNSAGTSAAVTGTP